MHDDDDDYKQEEEDGSDDDDNSSAECRRGVILYHVVGFSRELVSCTSMNTVERCCEQGNEPAGCIGENFLM